MLVDDQMLLREGLKTIISLQDTMEVVLEAENGKTAVELMENEKVDVILMDVRMPILNGVEATGMIKKKFPDVSIIILTTFDDDDYIIEALTLGADGYLLKDIDAPHLIQCIVDAHNGQLMLPSKVATKLASRISNQSTRSVTRQKLVTSDVHLLSEREKEIGALLVQGLSNSQIAKRLFLSEGTVKNYISELYQKLGTNNRTKASMLIKQIID